MTIDINELRKVIADCYWPTSPVAINKILDRLEEARTAWKEADKACRDLTEKVIPNLRESLEAAEKDIALKERVIDALGSELNAVAKERDAMRAMLRAALDVLEEVKGNINPERGYADELEADVERAIATIVIPGAKGE